MKGYYKWCKRLLNNWKQKNVEHIVNLFDENVEYYETPAEKINTINEISKMWEEIKEPFCTDLLRQECLCGGESFGGA